jgi:hypothetical protein
VAEKSKQDVKQEVEQRLREIELSTYLMFPAQLILGTRCFGEATGCHGGPDPHRRGVLHGAPEGTALQTSSEPLPNPTLPT